jgi:hypothetical protein
MNHLKRKMGDSTLFLLSGCCRKLMRATGSSVCRCLLAIHLCRLIWRLPWPLPSPFPYLLWSSRRQARQVEVQLETTVLQVIARAARLLCRMRSKSRSRRLQIGARISCVSPGSEVAERISPLRAPHSVSIWLRHLIITGERENRRYKTLSLLNPAFWTMGCPRLFTPISTIQPSIALASTSVASNPTASASVDRFGLESPRESNCGVIR